MLSMYEICLAYETISNISSSSFLAVEVRLSYFSKTDMYCGVAEILFVSFSQSPYENLHND